MARGVNAQGGTQRFATRCSKLWRAPPASVGFFQGWFGIIVDVVQRPAAQREFVVPPERWKIERTFGWLDWSRILSKEYERISESSESDIYLASIRLMLRPATRDN
jgi:transposase